MKYLIPALVVILIVAVAGLSYIELPEVPVVGDGIKTFASESDFKSYLSQASAVSQGGYFSVGSGSVGVNQALTRASDETFGLPAPMVAEDGEGMDTSAGTSSKAGRVSDTNVQVQGIDEPDIVKTDGTNIYFSYDYQNTGIIKAFPPSDLEELSKIGKNGEMLIDENMLVIFEYNDIYGYDISDKENPEQVWKMELNGSMVDARMLDGKIYMITRNYIDHYNPCPVVPLTRDGEAVSISCSSIYHPIRPVASEVTYNAMVFDPSTGNVEKAVSFVGSYSGSSVYMSTNAIYITYSQPDNFVNILTSFFMERASDILPINVIEKMNKINVYDISMQSKLTELQIIIENHMSTLDSDERLRIQNEITNRIQDYIDERKRDIMHTGIVKIGLDMEIKATGTVPGTLLNQFSLDEHEGSLRVAVTVPGAWSFNAESANDVYVLDSKLDIIGSIKDLGLTERIYSARFIGDLGFIVTFRQIDPFYVLDLSDPSNPQMKGELKIPGYSSYLHPISDTLILGIGKEDSNVKVSLFDVSDPENPVEADKYNLNEYWSEAVNNHHVFLMDKDHEIFFLPGGNGGYVFSYEDSELSLVKAVSDIRATRAIYLDNYLYILGTNEIAVLDETTWERVGELELEGYEYPYRNIGTFVDNDEVPVKDI